VTPLRKQVRSVIGPSKASSPFVVPHDVNHRPRLASTLGGDIEPHTSIAVTDTRTRSTARAVMAMSFLLCREQLQVHGKGTGIRASFPKG
jgi:hypothetical protein